MNIITLKNPDGETIEVKRGKIQGEDVILVRHSGKDADSFGEFNTMEILANKPKAHETLGKDGVYVNSEMGKQAMAQAGNLGFLILHGEQVLVGPEDGKLICEAVKQLD